MGNIDTFRDLVAWQRSMELAVAVYRLTRLLPKEEVYGLSAQMRRSSVSIPSNTAEGAGRRTTSDCIRFLHMAKGSANELDAQLELAARAGLLSPGQTCLARSLLNETHRLTQALTTVWSGNASLRRILNAATPFSPLATTAHYSLLTARYSLPTARCSLLTAHCSLPAAHCSLPHELGWALRPPSLQYAG